MLPVHLGMTLELAVPRGYLELDKAVDGVFRTIRQGGVFARRRIAFTSFSPQACAALNWKQPNCKWVPVSLRIMLTCG